MSKRADEDISDPVAETSSIKFNSNSAELEYAANASRLPYDKMTIDEVVHFSDILDETNKSINPIENYKIYIYLRNRILQVWVDNPKVQLVLDDVFSKIEPQLVKNEKILIIRIYKYLERNSYINFGVFKRITPLITPPKGKVIVIGAGIAGLAAARQLREFGLEVVIYEARERIGGRIATFRKGPYLADLGAMVVTGLGGNPIAILSKQISMDLSKIKQKCPLYDTFGKQVPKDRDEIVEKEFNKLLEATSYLTHNLDFDHKIHNKPISLGDALELLIILQEKYIKKKQLEHQTKLNNVQTKCKETGAKFFEVRETIKSLAEQIKDLKNKKNRIDEFELYSLQAELKVKCKEFNELALAVDDYKTAIFNMEENPPCDTFLHIQDRQLLDWHFANLEFANATPLSKLSLKHWDQDDEYEFTGSHMTVRNGYSCLPTGLSEGLNIKLNSAAQLIKYNHNGVEVHIKSTKPGVALSRDAENSKKVEIDRADAVLVTIPLGCLKEKASSMFEPKLPDWKLDAIKRLGFGNLNKIILCFEKVFWDPHLNLFGQVPLSTASRGEAFLFWNLYKAPVLLALVSGESASISENISDDVIIGRCLAILRGIFGNSQVPQPKEAVVTRWKSDPWSRGSYSFISVDSSGSDYELLAEPIIPPLTSSNDAKVPRIFFAGEHTNRNYPATVHGALLSGFREAKKIADIFLGSPVCIDRKSVV